MNDYKNILYVQHVFKEFKINPQLKIYHITVRIDVCVCVCVCINDSVPFKLLH